MILASWHKSENFGDKLTPWIISKFNKKTKYISLRDVRDKLLITGSILDNIDLHTCDVWGCGVINTKNKIYKAKNLIAVRGPISASLCPQTPKCIGDPGLLLPLLYKPDIQKTKKLAILPSWIDYKHCQENYPDTDILNILDPVENLINKILQYNSVICSCLHGLITCCAYGINTKWVKFSDNLIGDGTKFHDFLQSINFDYKCVDLSKNHTNITNLCHEHPNGHDLALDLLANKPSYL